VALLAPLAWLATGCAHEPTLTSPAPLPASEIQEVRITSMPPAAEFSRTVSDRQKIDSLAASWLFAPTGWLPAGRRELLPLYRIALVGSQARASVFWLGANSHPPRFPCYAICSGWWIAPSAPDGGVDASRYKPLTSAMYFPLHRDLEL
jgi:hypothetical protein